MPDYSKGKIYTIRCRTDNTLIYVGSTISSLSKRWGQHKGAIISKKYDLYTCREINGGFENWYIELYENYSCENKEQLFKKEGEIIRMIGSLNSKIAGRSKKEYAEENKEKMDKYKQEWCIERRKIKYTCVCGSTIPVCRKARHERSIKHTNYNLNSIL